jgi:hypothetical protein
MKNKGFPDNIKSGTQIYMIFDPWTQIDMIYKEELDADFL